jgi:arginase
MPKVNETLAQAPGPGTVLSKAPVYGGVQTLPPRKIKVIGVPLDLGASRRGVDMGPSAVRVAGLEARLEALGHEARRRQHQRGDR